MAHLIILPKVNHRNGETEVKRFCESIVSELSQRNTSECKVSHIIILNMVFLVNYGSTDT